jgi:hypothetical protein
MKKGLWTITLVLVFIGSNGWADDGDLIVNGKLGLGTENPTGVFEIAGQVSVSSTDAIPTMTSPVTPSGAATADSEYSSGSYPAWRAMDDDNSSYLSSWVSNENGNFPHWLKYDFSSGKIITSYSITARNYTSTFSPAAWTLQGSSNGSSWTDLDTRSGQSFSQNEKKTYAVSNTTSYTHYRLYITAGIHNKIVSIGELELIESAGTSAVSMFYVDESTGHVGIWSTNPGNYMLYVNGAVYATSYSGSDKRWKKNIKPISNAISLVEQMQGVRFEWRTEEFKDKHFEKGSQVGLIAQDVEPVIPEIVKTDKDGFKAVSYEKLTAVLIEAIKEQNQKIKELEAKINKIKTKNGRGGRTKPGD